MAKLQPLQTFNSIDSLKETFRVILPRPYEWRLLKEPMVGELNGLPESRGIAIATNGIIVAIQQDSSLFFGHLDFFIEDAEEPIAGATQSSARLKSNKGFGLVDFSEL